MRSNVHGVSLIPEVVDLFCGIGGLSYGLKSQGFVIKGGFDLDATCKYAFEHNIGAPFSIKTLKMFPAMKSVPCIPMVQLGYWRDVLRASLFLLILTKR